MVTSLAGLSHLPVVSSGPHVFVLVSAEEEESASAALLRSRLGASTGGALLWK